MRYPGQWTELNELKLFDRQATTRLFLGCVFFGLVMAAVIFVALSSAGVQLRLFEVSLVEMGAVALPFLVLLLNFAWVLVVKPAARRGLKLGWRFLHRDRRCLECDGEGRLSGLGACPICQGWAHERPFDRERAFRLDDEAIELLAEFVSRGEPIELDEERYAELNPSGKALDDATYSRYRAIIDAVQARLDALEECGLLRSHYVFRTMPEGYERCCHDRVLTAEAAPFLDELKESRRGLKPRARTAALAE